MKLFLTIILITNTAFAQGLLSPAGGSSNSANYQVNWLINGIVTTENDDTSIKLNLYNIDLMDKVSNTHLIVMNAYPNPVQDLLILEYNLPLIELKLYNSKGEEIECKRITSEIYKNKLSIDFVSLNSGIYLLKVINNDQTKDFKIIKL